jgi:hypothetical protein
MEDGGGKKEDGRVTREDGGRRKEKRQAEVEVRVERFIVQDSGL